MTLTKSGSRNGKVGLFLLADLLSLRKSTSRCILQLLYQMASLNTVFLYFSTFIYMYTVPNAKSVAFTEISNFYLPCYNNVDEGVNHPLLSMLTLNF